MVYDRFHLSKKKYLKLSHTTFKLIYHFSVLLQRSFQYKFSGIHFPSPLGSYWIRVMTPTENAFVGAGKTRSGFHTSMTRHTTSKLKAYHPKQVSNQWEKMKTFQFRKMCACNNLRDLLT